jgi:hypothetical protein
MMGVAEFIVAGVRCVAKHYGRHSQQHGDVRAAEKRIDMKYRGAERERSL